VKAGPWSVTCHCVIARAVVVAAGRAPWLTILLRAGPPSASRIPAGPVSAVALAAVALAPVVSAAAVPAAIARTAREVVRIFRSHVSSGQNKSNEDNHDNCRANHKLSHRTIQNDMASQCGARETHAAIDAGLTQ
jgi:hypothetical protein